MGEVQMRFGELVVGIAPNAPFATPNSPTPNPQSPLKEVNK